MFSSAGLSASQQQLVDRSSVGARQAQIEKLYSNILNLCQERAKRLSETCKAYQLVREAAELANWIKTKEQHAQIQVNFCFPLIVPRNNRPDSTWNLLVIL